jgi:hypothetical protein
MCEHRDLLLYNSLQLLTVFNFIDENDQLKVMCAHRDLLLYNSLQLLTVLTVAVNSCIIIGHDVHTLL